MGGGRNLKKVSFEIVTIIRKEMREHTKIWKPTQLNDFFSKYVSNLKINLQRDNLEIREVIFFFFLLLK